MESNVINVKLEVSFGVFVDEISILRIKRDKIDDATKHQNICELLTSREELLDSTLEMLSGQQEVLVRKMLLDLVEINTKLWNVEDKLRECEADNAFGDEFVQLARSVYKLNDERYSVKKNIDELVGSKFVEEKGYA